MRTQRLSAGSYVLFARRRALGEKEDRLLHRLIWLLKEKTTH